MKRFHIFPILAGLVTASSGQELPMPDHEAHSHAGHSMESMSPNTQYEQVPDSQPTLSPDEAEYEPYELMAMGGGLFGMLLIDQLEYQFQDDVDLLRWDAEGWYGGDFNRIWIKTEGEQSAQGPSSGQAELHGYYSRLITPFWEAQIGIRYDRSWETGGNSSRVFGAIGLQGSAPYNFEAAPVLFVSDDGDISARLTASKDLRITQRLIAQARFETEIAAQDAPEFGVGEGFNYVELGLRIRYEIRREFAPYIGVNWERKLGQTAQLTRESGEDPNALSFVSGIRFWF